MFTFTEIFGYILSGVLIVAVPPLFVLGWKSRINKWRNSSPAKATQKKGEANE